MIDEYLTVTQRLLKKVDYSLYQHVKIILVWHEEYPCPEKIFGSGSRLYSSQELFLLYHLTICDAHD